MNLNRKTIRSGVFLLFALAAFGSAEAAPRNDPAAILSGYELRSLDGKRFTIADLRGEVLMVNFWASWCKPCKKELPLMDAWNAEFSGKGGRVIAISVDHDRANAGRFVESSNLSLPVCYDGPHGLARSLDLPSLPCTYVLDRRGVVRHVAMKGSDEELRNLYDVMERLVDADDGGE
jgi:thiol-disulfide isomerase/thioredoxin